MKHTPRYTWSKNLIVPPFFKDEIKYGYMKLNILANLAIDSSSFNCIIAMGVTLHGSLKPHRVRQGIVG